MATLSETQSLRDPAPQGTPKGGRSCARESIRDSTLLSCVRLTEQPINFKHKENGANAMSQEMRRKVRFGDVDGASIVFYPRYFEMLNAAVEDWFEDGLGVSFAQMHSDRQLGTPTVALEAQFLAPSRLGETLIVSVAPIELGRASCKLRYVISCGGEERVRAYGVLVCMDLAKRAAAPWPEDVRARIEADLASG